MLQKPQGLNRRGSGPRARMGTRRTQGKTAKYGRSLFPAETWRAARTRPRSRRPIEPQGLHPTRTRQSKATSFSKVTRALTPDRKDKRAQYTAARSREGNPRMPLSAAGRGRAARRRARYEFRGRTASRSNSPAAARRPTFRTCLRVCSAAAGAAEAEAPFRASADAPHRRKRAPTSPTGSRSISRMRRG